jgi:hypothetical protein
MDIGNKNPALNNAGLQIHLKCFGPFYRTAELFSRLFCVAASRLNSPRFSRELYARLCMAVKEREVRRLSALGDWSPP